MAEIIFYQKPGCINNTLQKKRLRHAGHTVIEKNLLDHPWADHPDELRGFFQHKPVAHWFNRSAPAIKRGRIDPENMTANQAINLMIKEPLLIRRPLMESGGRKMAGFIEQDIDDWIGLDRVTENSDAERCPKTPTDCGVHG